MNAFSNNILRQNAFEYSILIFCHFLVFSFENSNNFPNGKNNAHNVRGLINPKKQCFCAVQTIFCYTKKQPFTTVRIYFNNFLKKARISISLDAEIFEISKLNHRNIFRFKMAYRGTKQKEDKG